MTNEENKLIEFKTKPKFQMLNQLQWKEDSSEIVVETDVNDEDIEVCKTSQIRVQKLPNTKHSMLSRNRKDYIQKKWSNAYKRI